MPVVCKMKRGLSLALCLLMMLPTMVLQSGQGSPAPSAVTHPEELPLSGKAAPEVPVQPAPQKQEPFQAMPAPPEGEAGGRIVVISNSTNITLAVGTFNTTLRPFPDTKVLYDGKPVGVLRNKQEASITGQLVETISGQFEAGSRSVTWDASDVASGVYFYKVSAGDFTQTMKMTLLK